MAAPLCSDDDFIRLFTEHGADGLAKLLGTSPRQIYERRRRLERIHDIAINSPKVAARIEGSTQRMPLEMDDGVIIVGSDAHYWPGLISTAHRGMVKLIKELKPYSVILNGDVFDGAKISRHPPLGFEKKPTVKEELAACLERVTEIEDAAKDSVLFWTIGNHDARFEARLAMAAHEFEGVAGFSLKEHFPKWQYGLVVRVNDDTVVKHRFKGGIHATHTNTLNAGKTMVTGHLHALKVTPFSDYNGTRWGVDTGTLADPYGDQFTYSEDNPLNHRSGFIVLTYHKGVLLWPEIAAVIDAKRIQFRGRVIEV